MCVSLLERNGIFLLLLAEILISNKDGCWCLMLIVVVKRWLGLSGAVYGLFRSPVFVWLRLIWQGSCREHEFPVKLVLVWGT